jgi:hypothetical protein
MKPKKIVLFISVILCGLLTVSFFFPKEGIKITDSWVLHFPTMEELFESNNAKTVDISQIVSQNQVPEDSLDSWRPEMSSGKLNDSVLVYYEPKPINPKEVTRKLEFAGNDKSVLYPFFKELSEIQSNGHLIRILHYGDSQIEADRISSFLRNKFQGQFGGSGPGLIAAVPPFDFDSPVKYEYSESWLRFTGFGKKDSSVHHNRYGVLASFSRFAPYTDNKDSVHHKQDSLKGNLIEYKAWLNINHSKYSFQNVKNYSQCRIFYGYNKYPVNLKVLSGAQELDKKILLPSENLQVKKWTFAETPPFLRFEFSGFDSPDIFAIALDGAHGVAVDNIPLRGSSGLIFTNMNQGLLQAIYQNLNAKLIILEFGGNIAPSILDNYDFYESGFYSQLLTLKRLIPGVCIIVIGIADMSLKDKDKYVSYPNVVLIRDALKKATFKAKCAYWDTYEAMGGQNSMPSWVFSEPPLAEKDFTHFTVKGSGIVAQMFYKALMFEYNSYYNQFIKNKQSANTADSKGAK